jgi:hypothetical protein
MIEKIFPLYKVGKIGDFLFLRKRYFIFYKRLRITRGNIITTPYFKDEQELINFLVDDKYNYDVISKVRSMFIYISNSKE